MCPLDENFSGMWARRSAMRRDAGASGSLARSRARTWRLSEKRRSAISSLRLKPRVLRNFHACAVETVTPAVSADSDSVRVLA